LYHCMAAQEDWAVNQSAWSFLYVFSLMLTVLSTGPKYEMMYDELSAGPRNWVDIRITSTK